MPKEKKKAKPKQEKTPSRNPFAVRGPLPFMRTFDDAMELAKREHDSFYPTAFMIEAWIGEVTFQFAEEYSQKKRAAERRLQVGQTWKAFSNIFRLGSIFELHQLTMCLLRYTQYDDPYADLLNQVFIAIGTEHDLMGNPMEHVPPNNIQAFAGAQQQYLQRLCEWIDSAMHWRTHQMYYLSPVSFHSDPERRELASLGINQRAFPLLDDYSKEWWNWHHSEAAERYKGSSKWKTIGEAAVSEERRTWAHPNVDRVAITFWALATRYNWTYADLMGLVRELLPQYREPSIYRDSPAVYRSPLDCEPSFTTHCNNVLGLRKGGRGTSSPTGKPQGYEIALKLAPPLS